MKARCLKYYAEFPVTLLLKFKLTYLRHNGWLQWAKNSYNNYCYKTYKHIEGAIRVALEEENYKLQPVKHNFPEIA